MEQVTLVFECVQDFCPNKGATETVVIPIRESGFYIRPTGFLCSFCQCEPEIASAQVAVSETV
jgi:hypothetical protein